MVMADVSGKGVPAALFMMISKTLIKSAAQLGLSPKEVLEKVNNQLCENNEAEMFVTVWLGIYEISTGKLLCANAGHEYPAIKRGDGKFQLFRDKHGLVLAGMENVKYREYQLELFPGDMLFVYTDGVPEATNGENHLYGTDRMLDALNIKSDVSCEELLHEVKLDIDAFVQDAPQFDDITMLCLQRKATEEKGTAFLPELEQMAKVTAYVEAQLETAVAPRKVIAQTNVAVDEIFSNIARYSGAKQVWVQCSVTETTMTLTFTDDGKPYDPTKMPEPNVTLSAEEREVGGLGIFMVKKSMDHIEYAYENGQNILTLTKAW